MFRGPRKTSTAMPPWSSVRTPVVWFEVDSFDSPSPRKSPRPTWWPLGLAAVVVVIGVGVGAFVLRELVSLRQDRRAWGIERTRLVAERDQAERRAEALEIYEKLNGRIRDLEDAFALAASQRAEFLQLADARWAPIEERLAALAKSVEGIELGLRGAMDATASAGEGLETARAERQALAETLATAKLASDALAAETSRLGEGLAALQPLGVQVGELAEFGPRIDALAAQVAQLNEGAKAVLDASVALETWSTQARSLEARAAEFDAALQRTRADAVALAKLRDEIADLRRELARAPKVGLPTSVAESSSPRPSLEVRAFDEAKGHLVLGVDGPGVVREKDIYELSRGSTSIARVEIVRVFESSTSSYVGAKVLWTASGETIRIGDRSPARVAAASHAAANDATASDATANDATANDATANTRAAGAASGRTEAESDARSRDDDGAPRGAVSDAAPAVGGTAAALVESLGRERDVPPPPGG